MEIRGAVARDAARHSLVWLVAANLVGLWLAAILLWPELGDRVAPLTYGRWVPLHLDWQLYGWCALPLVAALLHARLDPRHPHARTHARVVLAAWSLALVFGGASSLAGIASGKPFLDWWGPARWPLPLAMIMLWTVLAAHTWWRRHEMSRGDLALRAGLLLALATVPPVLFLFGARSHYPAVNPDSGGATGAALLGSTLGVVTLFGLLPRLLERPAKQPVMWYRVALAASWLVFALMNHGSVSHHTFAPGAGLALLLIWVPLVAVYARNFAWPDGARPWLGATFAWWLLLVVTGWLTFLPGFSERLKFTNGLVAHSHLAMAGLLTSLNGVILQTLSGAMNRRGAFWLWQLGCAAQVGLLLALGWVENAHAADLFRSEAWTQWLYGARLAAGLAMTAASVAWLKEVWR